MLCHLIQRLFTQPSSNLCKSTDEVKLVAYPVGIATYLVKYRLPAGFALR